MSVIDVTSIRRTINHDGVDDPCLAGQKAPNHRRLCGKVAELNYKRAVVVIRQSNFSTRILSLSLLSLQMVRPEGTPLNSSRIMLICAFQCYNSNRE